MSSPSTSISTRADDDCFDGHHFAYQTYRIMGLSEGNRRARGWSCSNATYKLRIFGISGTCVLYFFGFGMFWANSCHPSSNQSITVEESRWWSTQGRDNCASHWMEGGNVQQDESMDQHWSGRCAGFQRSPELFFAERGFFVLFFFFSGTAYWGWWHGVRWLDLLNISQSYPVNVWFWAGNNSPVRFSSPPSTNHLARLLQMTCGQITGIIWTKTWFACSTSAPFLDSLQWCSPFYSSSIFLLSWTMPMTSSSSWNWIPVVSGICEEMFPLGWCVFQESIGHDDSCFFSLNVWMQIQLKRDFSACYSVLLRARVPFSSVFDMMHTWFRSWSWMI